MNEKHIGWRNCPNCGKELEVTSCTVSKIYCSENCKKLLNKEYNSQLRNYRRKLKSRVLTDNIDKK